LTVKQLINDTASFKLINERIWTVRIKTKFFTYLLLQWLMYMLLWTVREKKSSKGFVNNWKDPMIQYQQMTQKLFWMIWMRKLENK
jgi:hypothetical protein